MAFVFSLLFRLSEVISAILAMRILIQFIGQAIGLLLLRKTRSKDMFPYKMPFFPVPVYTAIAMWLFILYSTGLKMMAYGAVVIAMGTMVFFIKAKINKEWPFTNSSDNNRLMKEA